MKTNTKLSTVEERHRLRTDQLVRKQDKYSRLLNDLQSITVELKQMHETKIRLEMINTQLSKCSVAIAHDPNADITKKFNEAIESLQSMLPHETIDRYRNLTISPAQLIVTKTLAMTIAKIDKSTKLHDEQRRECKRRETDIDELRQTLADYEKEAKLLRRHIGELENQIQQNPNENIDVTSEQSKLHQLQSEAKEIERKRAFPPIDLFDYDSIIDRLNAFDAVLSLMIDDWKCLQDFIIELTLAVSNLNVSRKCNIHVIARNCLVCHTLNPLLIIMCLCHKLRDEN